MTPPTACPPLGICLPVRLIEVRDGDTCVVRTRHGGFEWALRLLDCWCPELHDSNPTLKKLGQHAKDFAEQVLSGADAGDLRAFVPLPDLGEDAPLNVLAKLATFDRVLAYLYVGPSQTLNRMLVNVGLASTVKGGKLGQ